MDGDLPERATDAVAERVASSAPDERNEAIPPPGDCCWDPEIICVHLLLAEAQWKREEAEWRQAERRAQRSQRGLRGGRLAARAAELEWLDECEDAEPNDSAAMRTAEIVASATAALGKDFAVLGSTPGGPQLAQLLAGLDRLDPRLLDRAQQLELAAAARRVEAWAASITVAAAGAMAEPPFGHDPSPACKSTATDLAMRLGISSYQAGKLVKVGAATARVLAGIRESLAAGEIDYSKARVLVESLDEAPATVAWAIERDLLPAAPGMTTRQLQEAAQQALTEVDPQDAENRHVRARSARHVSSTRLRADGMASITAVLPAEDCVMIDHTLRAMAKSARHDGDGRTTDQLRADALVSLTAAGILTGTTDPIEQLSHGSPGSSQQPNPLVHEILRARPHERLAVTRPEIRVNIPWDVLDQLRSAPSEATSHSGLDAPTIAPGATGAAHESQSCGSSGFTPAGAGARDALESHRLDDVLNSSPTPAAQLTGYGAIPAVTALSLLAVGALRRIVTKPVGGEVLDVGRRHRAPPPRLAELVRYRDGTCTRPGCTNPMEELDHIVSWGHGGATDAGNLQALCSSCHSLKTEGRLRVVRIGDRLTWLTSTGHAYTRTAQGGAQLVSVGEPPY
ncbi:HNH endonuclease signature motif containing protein [Bogoriella caseilytica]|uniref:HNH endonuclease n=1 Tax=Bogoriella caseilytica TaxID=56055 RepID=A0A3N2BGM7_9MICO|nr:HNH endonuclease signature motif containing protein [Bogoriella caseilytica]ROR74416.1 HNH endonuclease [Bogoriella caseilytica]